MTGAEAVTMVLQRVGLDSRVTTYRAQALLYVNAQLRDIEGRGSGNWWWLYRTATLSTANGTAAYQLVAYVQRPIAFCDTTNNRSLPIVTADKVNRIDPDGSESGYPKLVYLNGMHATTGYQVVGLYPIPDAAYTISYDYYAICDDIADNDNEMQTAYRIPKILQPSVWLGASKLYLQELQFPEASAVNAAESERVIKSALAVNSHQTGYENLRLSRRGGPRIGPLVSFVPEDGSLG